MITSFKDKETEKIFNRKHSGRIPTPLYKVAWRKLAMLHAAGRIEDLKIPPGNKLEKLSGKREGQYSIRINEKYRICFRWQKSNCYDVEITDYH